MPLLQPIESRFMFVLVPGLDVIDASREDLYPRLRQDRVTIAVGGARVYTLEGGTTRLFESISSVEVLVSASHPTSPFPSISSNTFTPLPFTVAI